MTTTKTVYGIDSSTTLVAEPSLDQTDLILIDSGSSDTERYALYQLASGDEDHPATVRVALYPHPTANNGMGEYVMNIKLMTSADEVDDTSGDELVAGPFVVSMTVIVPGKNPVFDATQLQAAVANLRTLLFTAVDGSNIPDAVITDKLKFGVPNIF